MIINAIQSSVFHIGSYIVYYQNDLGQSLMTSKYLFLYLHGIYTLAKSLPSHNWELMAHIHVCIFNKLHTSYIIF